mgnify:CR=1 FL=1
MNKIDKEISEFFRDKPSGMFIVAHLEFNGGMQDSLEAGREALEQLQQYGEAKGWSVLRPQSTEQIEEL